MARDWKARPAPAKTSLQEIARRYHAAAVALAQTLGLALPEVLAQHRESVTAIFIEASRAELRAMTSPHEVLTPGTREHFLQVTTLRRWGTIQEYVELCRMQGYFTDMFYQKAAAHMERIHVRRMLRQVTDGRGWPTVANIVRAGEDGRPERVFMQEELFGPEEYRQVVAYHYAMARHHLFKARTYRAHAKARYGLQLPLFDKDDGAVGDETGGAWDAVTGAHGRQTPGDRSDETEDTGILTCPPALTAHAPPAYRMSAQ